MDGRRKKKLSEEVYAGGATVDPLAHLQASFTSYDIAHKASVYYNMPATRAWTRAWFNGNEKSEDAVAIPVELAKKFVHNEVSLEDWLTRFYPKQMGIYQKALEQTKNGLIGY